MELSYLEAAKDGLAVFRAQAKLVPPTTDPADPMDEAAVTTLLFSVISIAESLHSLANRP